MKKVILCGHTGSVNRGCEAIVRSTVEILRKCGIYDIRLMTFQAEDDQRLGLDRLVPLVPYKKKNIFRRGISYIMRKLFQDGVSPNKFLYRDIVNNADQDTVFFNIGGDTYCYGTPYLSYTLNELTSRKRLTNVFWGCSVESALLNDKFMIRDINKYTYIVVREELSQNIFQKCVNDSAKIIKTCDPAFHLPVKMTPLPACFVEKNTVGLNISPLVLKERTNEDDIMYRNVYELIDYVLAGTNMNICLIPHVYNIQENTQDIAVLRKIYAKYENSGRVGIVDTELSCTELKYIISQCRFFIGARTHSVIAAYSSHVPALALSYSIKSRGIAQDIFGEVEDYVLSYKNICENDELKNKFVHVLLKNEEKIMERYAQIMPEYKKSILEAAQNILR